GVAGAGLDAALRGAGGPLTHADGARTGTVAPTPLGSRRGPAAARAGRRGTPAPEARTRAAARRRGRRAAVARPCGARRHAGTFRAVAGGAADPRRRLGAQVLLLPG